MRCTEKLISGSFQIERNMIVVPKPNTVLVHNQKENCHYDRVPFDLKGIMSLFRGAYRS